MVRMDLLNTWLLHAAGQLWLFPVLLVFFFVDGFATILPSETALVALAALSLHSGQPNLVVLGLIALVGAVAGGDNTAYLLGANDRHRAVGVDAPTARAQDVRVGQVRARQARRRLIFTARYIPWGGGSR